VWCEQPDRAVVLVDDIATSGWHIEEAQGMVRGRGLPAFGAVWISGTIR
jgi:hypothetical protein